jgi:hypothetical protein
MIDSLMIWGLWLTVALSLLIIACGAFMRRNLRGFRPDMRWRLTYILLGMGGLLGAFSSLLMQTGQSTWPAVDRHVLSLIEGMLVLFALAMEATAMHILVQRQNQLRNRARAARRQAS